MGGRVESSSKLGKVRGTFTAVLASAILEWLLIFMLIVYAIFGYLITRFARYCELHIPCLLCSRIDNILGGEKAGFYWDMICRNHKLEMSSLVYCHFHEKLVDVRGMCETCLFSFATKDKSNAETYRLLVGKLGEEDLSGFDEETLNDDHLTNKLKLCSCCNELWNPRRQTLLQTRSSGFDAAQFDCPLYRDTSQDLGSLENEGMKTTQASSTIINVREMTEDPLNHFGYTDLKITSDTESDVQDSLEKEAEKMQAPTNLHVREKTEDQFGFTEVKFNTDNQYDIQASDIHDSLEEAKTAQTSSTIIHVREKTVDHFGYTDLKLTSDTESDIHDCLEEANKPQASSTIIHVREKTEDDFGYTDLKLTSDTESDIHDSVHEAKKTQASSTIIHVREKTEDHFGYADLKLTSDTESDVQAFASHDSLEEAMKTQASSTIIHVIEKREDHFGYADLKTTSDTESDIHDILEEAKKSQAASTIIHVREKTEDDFGYSDLKNASDSESDIQDNLEKETENIQTSSTIIDGGEKTDDPLVHFGFTELKITSDTDSDIEDRLEEAKKTQASSTIIHVGENKDDHFGYTNLKMNSDTESDIQTSDIEDAGPLISDDPLRDLMLESTHVEPFISVSEDDISCKRPVDLDVLSPHHSQISRDLAPSDIVQLHDSPSVASIPAIGHGLEELNWQEIDHKPNVSTSNESINVIDDTSNPVISTEMIGAELLSDTQNGDSVAPDFSKDELNADEATAQTLLYESDKNEELESLQTATNLNSSETRSEHTNADQQTINNLELSDAYKLAVSSRGRQSSEKLSEQLVGKNSSSTNMDLKLLLSQFSKGLNLPSTGILSPRVSRNFDELKNPDISAAMKLLQKRASLERSNSRNSMDRNESGVESLDFSTVAEIEGETEHDRLKRQIEHDKKFLIALVKELEEERNASASAANEAMAMITRLQEEKAALQMEASQELRMMEEQAEYDIDALDKLNDLVTEKEREIQNLEAELDYYRSKYPNESYSDVGDSLSDEKDKSPPNEPWVITQDEREYLSESLKNLEKKLTLFCNDVRLDEVGPKETTEKDENVVISQKDSLENKESLSIVNEVSRLNDRLKVLESDCSFIELAINALSDGHEELIQEIASHLRELHKVGIRRCQT